MNPSPPTSVFPPRPARPAWSGSRWLDGLLPAGAVAVALALAGRAPVVVFLCAAVGLIPLAAVLGNATQDLAARSGPMAAGLLEATLGNASELILGLLALRAGLVEIVKASITGSIISNLLLVLGLAMVTGGRGRRRQVLDRSLVAAYSTMLFLAAVGLIVPGVFALGAFGETAGAAAAQQRLSLWTAGVLIVIYLVSIRYELGATPPPPASERRSGNALLVMTAAMAAIAVLSELVVRQLGAARAVFHGGDLFWGGIVFALVGNAAEHVAAIAAARRNQMDLAVAISIGSSLQIALLLAPVLVFCSLALGHPMSLVFTSIEIVAVVLSTAIVALITSDGETNGLEGAQLLAVYAILAAAFYLVPM